MSQFKTHVILRLVVQMLSAEMENALVYQNILEILMWVVVPNVYLTPNAQEIEPALTESALILV